MDILKNNIVVGLGIAVAATALAPFLLPMLGGVGRPLAKSLIRGGMALYEKGRESVALAGESLEDLMAEVRADDAIRAEQGAGGAAGGAHDGVSTDQDGPRADGALYRSRSDGAAEAAAQAAGTVGV